MNNKELKMFVTDFDGTLLSSDKTVLTQNLLMLEKIGNAGVIRVIATGRSLFSFQKAVPERLPVDYLIFSSGGCIARYPDPEKNILKTHNLRSHETEMIISVFYKLGYDFMIQAPFPDNHIFEYHGTSSDNPDFQSRIDLYQGYAKPLKPDQSFQFESSQAVAIVPHDQVNRVDIVKTMLPGFHVVRTTSPLDHSSIWIEIFPRSVSKSSGTRWLSEKLGIQKNSITAIGNDYNDLDLLNWAGNSFVVANAPGDLKEQFRVARSNDSGGVADVLYQTYELPPEIQN